MAADEPDGATDAEVVARLRAMGWQPCPDCGVELLPPKSGNRACYTCERLRATRPATGRVAVERDGT